ncbi:KLTH0F04048p [Lachancea thermotolerans CBS 6340]|uniref:KLTH0F04048p n=1 Tax=Lachancea thermotolerans (strain ATCC 56472 / CBS 6340 / NRRL Y-8284) TaxID=559295 RepID=C5DKE6_LACTC|nr:KLTH0F04048p [Lachancea thermotolerans CBS 6340]CAR23947.1 KLTH0F04048p [Lachancea thermotolerans CBS 6340]
MVKTPQMQELPLSPYASKVAIDNSHSRPNYGHSADSWNNEKSAYQVDQIIDVEDASMELIEGQEHQVARKLKSRHIQLIALGGAIGTGLFIGSGGALSVCGPAPLLISYMIMSFFVWCIMNFLTEMVCMMPISGETSMFAMTGTYLNKPLSFMCGINLFYAMSMIAPSEITATAILIQYWTDANSAIFISIFIVVTVSLTMLPVHFFGESEFWVSIIKLFCITGLVILGIVIFFGGAPNQDKVLGFHYWKHPGAFNPHLVPGNTGKFLACWTAIIKSGFSYVLVPEVVVSCAAEAKDPRRNMPRVAQRFVYRLALFYVCGSLTIGIMVGYDNSRLLNAIAAGESNAAASPFVIGIQEVGIRVLPHIINACILTSAYSCGTSVLYGASRVLHSMAVNGAVPKIFATTNRFGTPYYSTAAASVFCLLAYLNCSDSSSVVFTWLSNIATISGFVDWMLVCVVYLRFRKVIEHANLTDKMPFRKRFMKPLAYLSCGFFAILSLTNGYAVFVADNWNVSDFFACYTTLGLAAVLYIGAAIYYKTIKLRDLDEVAAEIIPKIAMADEEEKGEVPIVPKNWLEKVWYFLV